MADCVLALGFEQMQRGALTAAYAERPSPMTRSKATMHAVQGTHPDAPSAPQYFGGASEEFAKRNCMDHVVFAKGHPLGATGLAQCTELVWQLRGTADAR